jgi:hypothetical protein
MTLLEKAKNTEAKNQLATPEQVELAVAFIKDEIKAIQLVGTGEIANVGNAYLWSCVTLRRAFKQGMLDISVKI